MTTTQRRGLETKQMKSEMLTTRRSGCVAALSASANSNVISNASANCGVVGGRRVRYSGGFDDVRCNGHCGARSDAGYYGDAAFYLSGFANGFVSGDEGYGRLHLGGSRDHVRHRPRRLRLAPSQLPQQHQLRLVSSQPLFLPRAQRVRRKWCRQELRHRPPLPPQLLGAHVPMERLRAPRRAST